MGLNAIEGADFVRGSRDQTLVWDRVVEWGRKEKREKVKASPAQFAFFSFELTEAQPRAHLQIVMD